LAAVGQTLFDQTAILVSAQSATELRPYVIGGCDRNYIVIGTAPVTRPIGRTFIPTRPAGRFSTIHIGWLWLPYVRWVAMVRILRLQVQHQKIRSPDLGERDAHRA
jgi:hypothetical protein